MHNIINYTHIVTLLRVIAKIIGLTSRKLLKIEIRYSNVLAVTRIGLLPNTAKFTNFSVRDCVLPVASV